MDDSPFASLLQFLAQIAHIHLNHIAGGQLGLGFLRELCGGGVFQMPADISVMNDPDMRTKFETYWQTPQMGAVERMKLFKLAWDMVGSEFAGRHQQYEKFYAGASFIIRNHSYRETNWAEFNGLIDKAMAAYDMPGAAKAAAE